MPKRRPKKRNYRTITFKVYYDTDEDILDWWEGIEVGERSDAIRDVIREQIGLQPHRKAKVIDLPELLEVRRDTLWIRDALNDMPAYLERVIQYVAANTVVQPVTVGQHPPRASPPVQNNEPALTDDDAERRTKRMRKATW
ncbi:hypothetical protein FBR02_14925 [Anaerolineae bacterium CFX9]|jgi:hypothetical protein|nr:hypothetical protein [Anaerolineae bacterium CFX9]